MSDAIEILRGACEGWPQPNRYDDALDRLEALVLAADDVSRIEATGVLPDFMPLHVALRAVKEARP